MQTTHTTINDSSREGLDKRIEAMKERGYELDSEIVPQDSRFGIKYYAKLKYCGKM